MKFKQKSKRKEVGYQICNEFDKIGKVFGGGGEWVLGCKMMMCGFDAEQLEVMNSCRKILRPRA